MSGALRPATGGESSQKVSLHPLVLLTASDLITRHRLRGLEGPAVGLILGNQTGTETTAEHAFTAKLHEGLLDHREDWTNRRIQQYKDVHKTPALEVVGWFSLCPEEGPLPVHAALHTQVTSTLAENPIFLAIHAASFDAIEGTKGALPLTVYEGEEASGDAGSRQNHNSNEMQVDGMVDTKFRPVPYSIETDETEMIAINYVAKGAGSAAAVSQNDTESKSTTKDDSNEDVSTGTQKIPGLTPEEEDQVAGMTTRLNSVKMLQSRLQLLSRLVASIPLSYLTNEAAPLTENTPTSEHTQQLRNIQALLTRLNLLSPAATGEGNALAEASRAQSNDVALASLLTTLTNDVQHLSELGRKFNTVEQTKSSSRGKAKGGFGGGFIQDDTPSFVGLS